MTVINSLEAIDIRFPTSRELDGSDAMNKDPDYSTAYVILKTDRPEWPTGYGFVFTIGRGNDVECAAIRALRKLVVGYDADDMIANLGAFAQRLTNDSQLRWLGPEKGVMHMAIGAVINAAWDLAARRAGKPLWRFIADMTPEQIVDVVDFRYIADAITRDEALSILRDAQRQKAVRIGGLIAQGYPAYTTSPGWLGYSDAKLVQLSTQAIVDGFNCIKLKVGGSLNDDLRRCAIARQAVGSNIAIAIDANQRWNVREAIDWLRPLAKFDITWIEEPTSPDDILGHAAIRQGIAPMPVSTGEHTQNRIIFKQLFQAQAVDLIQIDATRVGGVNENLAILLMAAKFGIRVCPHAGGVGLCELVQHLAMADYVTITGKMNDRYIEYIDHLHQHFVSPVRINRGRYVAPSDPGFSAQMHESTVARYQYPNGQYWSSTEAVGDIQDALLCPIAEQPTPAN
jgi:L-fuconate dehydratase